MRSLLAAAVLGTASLVGLGGAPAHAATIVNVPATQPTIQAAIEVAVAGDTVLVAPGTYHERIDFKGKAIEVKSSGGPATTIIDGDATGITAVFHNAETRASVLRGFTITDGLAPMPSQLVGGGIEVKDASPTIVGNVVTANVGSGIGVAAGSPLIQDNVITANNTPYDGGGIWAGNSSVIVGNRIEDNTADDAAGLVIFGTTVVRNNVIRGNQAVGHTFGGGGGLIAYGGMVVNNLIANNTALVGPSAKGGGVLVIANDPPQLLHNTFVGNTSPIGSAIAGLGPGTVSGNVFVGPAGASVVHCAGSPSIFSFNDVFNGTTSRYECGASNGFDFTGWFGNIAADPMFVSPTDRHLQPGSPAIDAGDPSVTSPPATDLAGSPRITDGNGDGLAVVDMGAYEAPAIPIVGSRYHPLDPARILDTRQGLGAAVGPLGQGSALNLQVTGQGGVPSTGVSAVVLNVTVTEPTAASFLTAWPTGQPLPVASNLNYVAGQTVPNLVVVNVGDGGLVSLYNSNGSTHVVADVAGWYGDAGSSSGARYTSVVPSRILDTRNGIGGPQVGPDASIDLQVTGQGGVPVDASAVVLNVTVTQPTATSFVTAWPTGQSRPVVSNLNVVAGQTVPNLVVVKVGAGGRISLYNLAGTTHLIADVAGWFGADGVPGGSGYTSLVPSRILDTRAGVGAPAAAVGPGGLLELQVTGRGGAPATGVSAVVLNVTVTQPTAPSFLTVWPSGLPLPLVSNLNYVPNLTVPNLVVVGVGAGGRISLYNSSGTAHVVADVAGWYSQ
jgi:hypothetical protein